MDALRKGGFEVPDDVATPLLTMPVWTGPRDRR